MLCKSSVGLTIICSFKCCLLQIINEPRSDKRDLLAIKVQSEIFTEKKDQAVVNNYRKFEEIIFTSNKDMSVFSRIYDAFIKDDVT